MPSEIKKGKPIKKPNPRQLYIIACYFAPPEAHHTFLIPKKLASFINHKPGYKIRWINTATPKGEFRLNSIDDEWHMVVVFDDESEAMIEELDFLYLRIRDFLPDSLREYETFIDSYRDIKYQKYGKFKSRKF